MKAWPSASVMVLVGVMAVTPAVLGQTRPDCPKAETISGQIVKIDMNQGTMTLRAADGKTYEFHQSKEALQDKKVGDRLEIAKRLPEGCK